MEKLTMKRSSFLSLMTAFYSLLKVVFLGLHHGNVFKTLANFEFIESKISWLVYIWGFLSGYLIAMKKTVGSENFLSKRFRREQPSWPHVFMHSAWAPLWLDRVLMVVASGRSYLILSPAKAVMNFLISQHGLGEILYLREFPGKVNIHWLLKSL